MSDSHGTGLPSAGRGSGAMLPRFGGGLAHGHLPPALVCADGLPAAAAVSRHLLSSAASERVALAFLRPLRSADPLLTVCRASACSAACSAATSCFVARF